MYKSILVHVERGGEDRVRLALDLAKRHGASLIGLAADMWLPAIAASGFDAGTSAQMIQAAQEEVEANLKAAEESFGKWTEKQGVTVEWRSAVKFPEPLLVSMAGAADVVVMGSLAASQIGGMYHQVNPGDVVMDTGRPVLVVPPDVASVSGQKIVAGWKDTRESRRALLDALPLMTLAQSVQLVHVSEGEPAAESLRDAESFLAHHGVAVRSQTVSNGKSAHEELLRIATETSADLIVAGSYGRSRLREWIFGGVTRGLLTESPIACLFSH